MLDSTTQLSIDESDRDPGVSGFVHFGDRLGLLPDELKARMGNDELVEIDQGWSRDRMSRLQGLEALVTRPIAARDRVEILIELMGRSLRAETSVAHLVPLTGPRS